MKKKKIAKIVKLTSRNTGLSYIGVTNQPIENWIRNIVSGAKSYSLKNSKFQKALRKEGIQSFKKTILDHDPDYRFAKDQLLPMYISAEDTYNSGLNTLKGGTGTPGYKHANDQREFLSRRQKLRIRAGLPICSNKGRHFITNGWQNKMVTPSELVKGLPKGWKLGFKKRANVFRKRGVK